MIDLNSLVAWFQSYQRDLPWRKTPSPYAVWVSEVMLQQTQVAVVIPYYLRWMDQFPTVQALAKAPLEQVIKAWEGLGYYSRARNLHLGAQYVLEHFGGELPAHKEGLLAIKGIGDYTVGAILSFAFKQKAAAVDGNVQRVLSRLLGFEEDLSKTQHKKTIQQLCERVLPEKEPWIVSEALIELGALICTKKPRCLDCPLKKNCQAFLKAKTEQIPFKSQQIKKEKIRRTVTIIKGEEAYLLRAVPPGEIMEGLYEFPYFEGHFEPVEIAAEIASRFSIQVRLEKKMAQVVHGFTRYQATLYPFICQAQFIKPILGFEWVNQGDLTNLPFSSGHRKILHALDAVFIDN